MFHDTLVPCAERRNINMIFDGGATSVKDTWTAYVSGGNAVLAEPEDYITLR